METAFPDFAVGGTLYVEVKYYDEIGSTEVNPTLKLQYDSQLLW